MTPTIETKRAILKEFCAHQEVLAASRRISAKQRKSLIAFRAACERVGIYPRMDASVPRLVRGTGRLSKSARDRQEYAYARQMSEIDAMES